MGEDKEKLTYWDAVYTAGLGPWPKPDGPKNWGDD